MYCWYELENISFYLTKDNLLRETQKSDLERSLEEKLNKSIPDEVPIVPIVRKQLLFLNLWYMLEKYP